MKPLRSTFVLLLLAVIGGLYIYFNERGAAVSEGAVVLLRAPREGVQLIEFSPANLQLQRAGDSWRVKNARNSAPADPEAVNELLGALELVQSEAPVENAANLKEYGLEKAAARLEVDGKSLAFGISPPFDPSRVYARSADQIALVSADLSAAARKSFEGWRDRAVLRFDAEKVTAFSLQTPQLRAQFRKDGENWKVEKPLRAVADAEVVDAFLSALAAARVSKWLDESGDATKWGLEAPQVVVSLDGAKLEIGKRLSGGYAARNSAAKAFFLLPEATFALLNRPLRDWRDKTIARFDAGAATRLEIAAQDRRQVLLQRGGEWTTQNGESNPQTNAAALDLLGFAANLRARDFIDAPQNLAQYGLDKPFLTLQIEADSPFHLRFGKADSQIYAQEMGGKGASGALFVLNCDVLDALQQTRAKLLAPSPQ